MKFHLGQKTHRVGTRLISRALILASLGLALTTNIEAKEANCSTDMDCANLTQVEQNKALIKALKAEIKERKQAAKREALLAKQARIIDSLQWLVK